MNRRGAAAHGARDRAGPWAALDLALLLAIGWCLLAPLPLPRPAAIRPAPAPDTLPGVVPAAPAPPISVADLTARPLFSPARRPEPTPSSPPAADAAAQAARLIAAPPPVLIGIVHADAEALALLRDPRNGQPVRLRARERIGDWEVISITATAIHLRQASGAELRVELRAVAPAPASPSAELAVTPTPRRAPSRSAAR